MVEGKLKAPPEPVSYRNSFWFGNVKMKLGSPTVFGPPLPEVWEPASKVKMGKVRRRPSQCLVVHVN